jgi:hypothetical protein
MNTKILEDILFQVYELGVQQTDCDLTKKANTIMMLTNQRVIEELEGCLITYKASFEKDLSATYEKLHQRINELKTKI